MSTKKRVKPPTPGSLAVVAAWAAALFAVSAAQANGLGENGSWQFQTTQDKVNKGAIVDLMERKKGGYYDAIKTTVNNTTYIDKQFNCTNSATASGNAGTNGMTSYTSSPTSSNSTATNSNTSANSASNGVSQTGLNGVLVATAPGTPPSGSIGNDQGNSGNLSSGVNGSNTNGSTGAISANGGTSTQALNSTQTNDGATQTANISNSTACQGPLVGPLNGN